MSTAYQIRTLLQPPDDSLSVEHAISILDQTFTSLDQAHLLAESVASSKVEAEELQSKVSHLEYIWKGIRANSLYLAQLNTSQANVDAFIQSTRNRAKEQLVAAQELSLLRHSLSDELSGLSEELASAEGDAPTLLEEIESLHRKLKELESVKEYVQVIHRALQLKYVTSSLHYT